jgi:uncharacterized delta-60 repeat protein
VSGPRGTQVVIPAGALAGEVRINIEETSTGAPALPAGVTSVGPTFALTPHGTTFAVPVTLTLPYDPAAVPAGRSIQLFKTIQQQTEWQPQPGAVVATSTVSAPITSFSLATVVLPPVTPLRVTRAWSFRDFRGDALEEHELAHDEEDVDIDKVLSFGPAHFDLPYVATHDGESAQIPSDGIADGTIGSYKFGNTYWVGVDAPKGNSAIDTDAIGSKARLVQYQTFVKNADDATYTFTVTGLTIDAYDGNKALQRFCPLKHALYEVMCDLMNAEVMLEVKAWLLDDETELPKKIFYELSGGLRIVGGAVALAPPIVTDTTFLIDVPLGVSSYSEVFDRVGLDDDVTTESFETTRGDGHRGIRLTKPKPLHIDLSEVPRNSKFMIRVTAHAYAYDRAAGPVSGAGAEFRTAAHAWLRDPAGAGGTTVVTTGLTQIDTPANITEPPATPLEPVSCVPGPAPDPSAGLIEFSAANYVQAESASIAPVKVVRRGGTAGRVTATLRTSDGTAVTGVDYAGFNASAIFGDGDALERSVDVGIIQDTVHSEPDKTVTLTLSQPGGCAAIGAQDTATLTIIDDDPAPPPPSGLDETFGTAGKTTMSAFGGDRSAMAIQPDGKIVMAGGTFASFVLARFNANGSVDTSFGNAGKVSTTMLPTQQQEALGVAVQPDGKIVVVGYTAVPAGPSTFALARYLPSGELDTSFGNGGKITSGVAGRAFAVAIQRSPETKIVVVGDELDGGDIAVARYNEDVTLDSTFSGDGQLVTNVAGRGDIATNVVLQTDGAILVSGGNSEAQSNSAIARYLPDGSLDATFGVGGLVALPGKRVGEGLAVQHDGKILLVGNADGASPATPSFSVMRLNADGTTDNSFGTAGTVNTSITTRGDEAFSVALQPDRKIVVAGRGSRQTNSNFAVARYNTNGTLDTTFGNGNGFLTFDFFGFSDIAETVAIDRDGKIVLGGLARDNVDGYGLARVNP